MYRAIMLESTGTDQPTRPLPLPKLGILGGCSAVATVEYYKRINAAINAELGGWDIAETVVAGMNFGNVEALLRAGDWSALTSYMAQHVDGLVAAGADFVICVSNTLHQVMDEVMSGRSVPWLHITDPTGEAIRHRSIERVALFGTAPTMQASHIPDRLQLQYGIDVVVPSAAEQADIDGIIFDELVKWTVRDASRQRYVDIANRLGAEEGVQGIILGCTEIPLLVRPCDVPDLATFDTTQLHCEAAVRAILAPKV